MALQLDADMEHHLDGILSSAHSMLESVHFIRWRSGRIPAHKLQAVEDLRDDMIRLLALFEDGAMYGAVPPQTTYAMRGFEADAAELLEYQREFVGRLAS